MNKISNIVNGEYNELNNCYSKIIFTCVPKLNRHSKLKINLNLVIENNKNKKNNKKIINEILSSDIAKLETVFLGIIGNYYGDKCCIYELNVAPNDRIKWIFKSEDKSEFKLKIKYEIDIENTLLYLATERDTFINQDKLNKIKHKEYIDKLSEDLNNKNNKLKQYIEDINLEKKNIINLEKENEYLKENVILLKTKLNSDNSHISELTNENKNYKIEINSLKLNNKNIKMESKNLKIENIYFELHNKIKKLNDKNEKLNDKNEKLNDKNKKLNEKLNEYLENINLHNKNINDKNEIIKKIKEQNKEQKYKMDNITNININLNHKLVLIQCKLNNNNYQINDVKTSIIKYKLNNEKKTKQIDNLLLINKKNEYNFSKLLNHLRPTCLL